MDERSHAPGVGNHEREAREVVAAFIDALVSDHEAMKRAGEYTGYNHQCIAREVVVAFIDALFSDDAAMKRAAETTGCTFEKAFTR